MISGVTGRPACSNETISTSGACAQVISTCFFPVRAFHRQRAAIPGLVRCHQIVPVLASLEILAVRLDNPVAAIDASECTAASRAASVRSHRCRGRKNSFVGFRSRLYPAMRLRARSRRAPAERRTPSVPALRCGAETFLSRIRCCRWPRPAPARGPAPCTASERRDVCATSRASSHRATCRETATGSPGRFPERRRGRRCNTKCRYWPDSADRSKRLRRRKQPAGSYPPG